MNDLVAKISSYDIFSYLEPGAIFAFLLTVLDIYQVSSSSVVVDVVLFHFLSMIVSRIWQNRPWLAKSYARRAGSVAHPTYWGTSPSTIA